MKRLIKHLFNNLRYMDKQLFVASTIFIIFGLFNIVTASSREAVNNDVSLYYYFYKHLEMLLIGVFIGLFIVNIDTKKYTIPSIIFYIVIGFILIYLTFNGSSHRGAKNWINIGPITFQPSELAKPILIVCLSLLYENYYTFFKKRDVNHYKVIFFILFVGLFFAALIFLQKDLGTMMIISLIISVLFFSSSISREEKFKTCLFIVCGIVIGIFLIPKITNKPLLSEAQKSRFDYINPCNKYETSGYQICNGFIAINDGGLFGLGIGKSKQKYSYIPEPHTDSIFAIIVEEYGLIFCLFILFAYVFILWRILEISSKSVTLRGKYMCLGVAIYLFAHIFVNLGGLFGLIPLTGVPLPFLSYGGSFLVSSICSLCLVQRVAIENKKINNKYI